MAEYSLGVLFLRRLLFYGRLFIFNQKQLLFIGLHIIENKIDLLVNRKKSGEMKFLVFLFVAFFNCYASTEKECMASNDDGL
jgi:hypothetical protein